MLSPRSKSFFVRARSAAVLCLWALSLWISGCTGVVSRTATSGPVLALSTTSLNFNSVVVGQKATKTLQISNTGSGPLTIESLSLASQQFSFTGPAVPRTVLPAQSVAYSISFVPTASGSLSAMLEVSTDASSTPAAVSLAGVGEKAFAALQASPSALNFGNLVLQNTGTQTVTLKNTGDISLTIGGVTIAGAGFGFSNLSPGLSLSPSQSVSFQIWFRPNALGAASGTVSILSANLSSPASIAVSGTGVSSTTGPAIQHSVVLSWDASSSSSVTGYRVYRSSFSAFDFTPLMVDAISSLSYTDSTVASGNTYDYVVTAVDSDGMESVYSNQVTAVIP